MLVFLAMLVDLRQFTETFLLAVAALLPIVNPLGSAPIFFSMTADLPGRPGAGSRSSSPATRFSC